MRSIIDLALSRPSALISFRLLRRTFLRFAVRAGSPPATSATDSSYPFRRIPTGGRLAKF